MFTGGHVSMMAMQCAVVASLLTDAAAITITLNTSGCESAWTHVGSASWFGDKLSHPPFCQNDMRLGGKQFDKGAFVANDGVFGGYIVHVAFSFRYACGYGNGNNDKVPPKIFFEFVSNPNQSVTAAGSTVVTKEADRCGAYNYDNGTYSPVYTVSADTFIDASSPMYFRVRGLGGEDHNLQVPVYQAGGPASAGMGGLVRIDVTLSTLPLSIGSIILIVFFCGMVAPYLIGGLLYRRFVGGYHGWEAIPNRAFWANVMSLIGAGCVFSFGKAKDGVSHVSAKSGYEFL
eukprot:m.217562 g.217562  ORF g.217562 m.217562 type:complete len:289 (+) comp29155_c0_seq1:223-1089(+)